MWPQVLTTYKRVELLIDVFEEHLQGDRVLACVLINKLLVSTSYVTYNEYVACSESWTLNAPLLISGQQIEPRVAFCLSSKKYNTYIGLVKQDQLDVLP